WNASRSCGSHDAVVSPIDRIGRTSVLLLVVLALTAGLARSAAPPRLSFGGSGSLAVQRDEYRVDGGPSALAIGDLNGDGSVDLVVAKAHSSRVGVLLNDRDGTFAPHVDYPTAASPVSVAVADLD